jgi:hypothetical protein
MSTAQTVNQLRRLHFLRELGAEELLEVAADLERQEFEPGETIVRQGERAAAYVILLQGEAQAIEQSAEGEAQVLLTLGEGDTFGEAPLFHSRPYPANLVAAKATAVLLWPKVSLRSFLGKHDSAMQSFRLSADSQLLTRKVGFTWLAEDEVVHALSRKDANILWQGMAFPAVVLLIGLAAVVLGMMSLGPLALIPGIILGIFGLLFGLWRWVDWGNDYYVVTNKRVVWLEKVVALYDSRQEAPLHMVLSVSVSTDVVGRSLGYGDVVIRTYTGQLTFRNVSDPHSMAAIIEEQWRRVQDTREKQDRKVIVDNLRKKLEDGEEIPEEVAEQSLLAPEAAGKDKIGLDRWTFQIRFEEQGIITYRKHWAVLLRFVGLPSALFLLSAGFLGARLSGLIQLGSSTSVTLITLLLIFPLGAWWLYQYVDWANDIYQVTSDQIVDVYKKPLSSELRKVAPLENILSTEVKRKGISGVLLNYGDVIAEVGTAKFTFEGVFNPAEVQQDIVRAQEALLERNRQRDQQRRQDELLEWLTVYHQETQSDQSPEGER